MRASLLGAALLLSACTASNRSLRAEDFVEFEPVSAGKVSAPVGVRIRYPLVHPVGQPLPLEVEVWSTDGDANALTVEARPEQGIVLKDGQQAARFEGPVAAQESRAHRFVFEVKAKGPSFVNLDVGRTREGDAAHRTIKVPFEGGGRVEPPPGGKPPARPVRLQ